MREIVGQRIAALWVGPWSQHPGVELPGVAGSTWHYADAFASLESGVVLRLTPRGVAVVARPDAGAEEVVLEDDAGARCIGSRIQDVLAVDSETHLVLLEDGRYLANRFVPGGTSFHIGRFDDWEPDELACEAKSIVTGEAKDLRGSLRPR